MKGRWKLVGPALVSDDASNWCGLQLDDRFEGDYDLELDVAKEGGGNFEVYLGEENGETYFVGVSDKLSLWKVVGKTKVPLESPSKGQFRPLAPGKVYHFAAQVRGKRLTLSLNSLVLWKGDRERVADDSIQIAAFKGTATFRAIRTRAVNALNPHRN